MALPPVKTAAEVVVPCNEIVVLPSTVAVVDGAVSGTSTTDAFKVGPLTFRATLPPVTASRLPEWAVISLSPF